MSLTSSPVRAASIQILRPIHSIHRRVNHDQDHGRTGRVSVEVTITADRVYQQPTAVDDLVAFSAGSPVVVNVLANDLDPDGGPLTVSIVQAPTVGTAAVQADGTVRLSLPAGFRGFTR